MIIQSKTTFGDKIMADKETHTCKKCGKSFESKDDMMKHAKKTH